MLHPLTLTLPLIPEIARLLIGLIADVILPRGSIDDDAVPEPQTPFIFYHYSEVKTNTFCLYICE